MIKVISFLSGAGADGDGYQDWIIDRYGPDLMASDPALRRLVINRVIDPPSNPPFRSTNTEPGDYRFYDVIIDYWYDSLVAFQKAAHLRAAIGLGARSSKQHEFAVTETTVVERAAMRQGEVTPGIKFMGRLMFHEDLPDSAARRSWANHAILAQQVHIGMTRYVQNWVDATLTPSAPPTRGIPQLFFPSEADLVERFFDSERGRAEIASDTAHFVKSGRRFYCQELALKL
jgi:hypothetical protein